MECDRPTSPRAAATAPARGPSPRRRSRSPGTAKHSTDARRGRKFRQRHRGGGPLELRSAAAQSRRGKSASPSGAELAARPPPPRQRSYRVATAGHAAEAADPVPGLRMLCTRHGKWRKASLMVLGPHGDMHCIPPHTCRGGSVAAAKQFVAENPLAGLRPKAAARPPPPPPSPRLPPAGRTPTTADAPACPPDVGAGGGVRANDFEADYGDNDPSL